MKSKGQYPKQQKAILLNNLIEEMVSAQDEGMTYFQAFRAVSLNWLNYAESSNLVILDGANDRGFDAYRIGGSEIDIFQFKSQDYEKVKNVAVAADKNVFADLPRIISFLQSKDFSKEAKNRPLKRFVQQLQTAIQTAPEGEIISIRINIVALYDGLTQPARSEFNNITSQLNTISIFGREVFVEAELWDIDSLLGMKWRETNSQWQDAFGKKGEWLPLHYTHGSGAYINDKSISVIFARARDLIDWFNRFGYQIFEANVRCEIVKSQVNDAIRNQVTTKKGIDQFRVLNNGITIICTNKTHPQDGRMEVLRPQVVNGLQTVTSLHEAYDSLPTEMKQYFDGHCFVLTRIYDAGTIEDIPKLVRATNNQNKMESRNLRSNNPEQIAFEQSFAKMGWFYERKDFAWNAFSRSEAQWGTLKNFKARSFRVEGKLGRPTIRKTDNQDIGQHWLAFIGHVDDAAQRRKLIFEEDKYYNRIFMSRVVRSAYDYGFEFNDPKTDEETLSSSPSPEALLLAHLTYRLAKEQVMPSARLREHIVELRGWQSLKEDQLEDRLTKDADYITGLALSSGTFLFIEMCGLIFFRAFGAELYNAPAKYLLEKTDMVSIFKDADFDIIREKVNSQKFDPSDLFTSLWLLFKFVVRTELAENDTWRNTFFTESSKPRVMYRESTRRRILDRVMSLDKRAEERALNYEFSTYFENIGIINRVKKLVTSKK